MPSETTRHTLARQWELLKLLPTHGTGKTARDLAEALNEAGFRVSKRQVERDLGELMDSFPIDCNNRSVPYGWRWVKDASVDLPGLTLAEALSLHLIEETIRPLLPVSVLRSVEGRFRMARDKLASQKKLALVRWADKVRSIQPALPLSPPSIDAAVLETVQDALLNERQIEVRYRAMEDTKPKSLILHPLGMVQRGPVAYLVATAFDYPDVRLYALHRMSKAELIGEPARRSEHFDLDQYIDGGAMHFGGGRELRLVLSVDPGLARILEETPLAADQRIDTRDETVTVRATVADTWQLRWWLLSQGPALEVVKPAALRREIGETCRNMAAMYVAAD
jgi:predicted DNA-binding transcriptional regulator YafY